MIQNLGIDKLKYIKLTLLLVSTILTHSAYAALTETKSCDTCDFSDARQLAESYYEVPHCQASNLVDGNVELGTTTFECPTTSKEIIIANAINRKAFKFVVIAEQIDQYVTALSISSSQVNMTSDESAAINEFYEIDASFRQAVQLTGTVSSFSSDAYFPPKNFKSSAVSSATSSSSSDNCINHPSIYLTSEGARRTIHNEMASQIADRLGNDTWSNIASDTKVNGIGLSLAVNGGGASVSFQHDQIEVFATRSYGNTSNKLVFRVFYDGEVTTDGQRDLNLIFQLRTGSSRVDGIPLSTFMGGSVDLTTTLVSNCLLENLQNVAGAEIEVSGGSGAGGSGSTDPDDGGSFGVPIGTGGSCSQTVNYSTCSTNLETGARICSQSSVTIPC